MSIERVLRAGRFDQRIYIEELIQTTDSVGQVQYGPQAEEGSWAPVLECWAHIEDEYGVEQKQTAREVAETWAAIQVRWRAGLRTSTAMRVRHKVYGTIYDIRSVLVHVDEGRKIVEMNCLVVE
jgi:SPP1 family predicted phage head-tail adaptor